MPKIVEVTLYQFDELSDRAKERARDWWRDGESRDFSADDVISEGVETAAKLLGIEFDTHAVRLMGGGTRHDSNIWWRLHTQGSGASFQGSYSYARGAVQAIKDNFGANESDLTLNKIAAQLTALQWKYGNKLSATISTSGREVHSGAMTIDASLDSDELVDDADSDTLLGIMRDFADWIYSGIEAEYDYRMSEENVDDAICTNEYYFTVDGKRSDG